MGHPYWPLFDLRVRTPRVELHYPDDDDLCALVALADQGIHDPSWMPFGVGWTDQPEGERQRSSLQFHWRARASWSPGEWSLPMAVVVDGALVGVQALEAKDFPTLRVALTGSWLGRAHQGQGIGQEMRAAILHLLFAGLGGARAVSGAWEDNAPSLGVSRALGYVENGDTLALRRGKPSRQVNLVLSREMWEARRRDDIEILGIDACRESFGLL